MRRQAEQHEGQRVLQPIAAAADVVEFIDEIEEREQRQKADQYESHRGSDLPAQVTAQNLHVRSLRRANDQRGSLTRRQNRKPMIANSAACSTHTPRPNDMRPSATQACTTDNRLL